MADIKHDSPIALRKQTSLPVPAADYTVLGAKADGMYYTDESSEKRLASIRDFAGYEYVNHHNDSQGVMIKTNITVHSYTFFRFHIILFGHTSSNSELIGSGYVYNTPPPIIYGFHATAINYNKEVKCFAKGGFLHLWLPALEDYDSMYTAVNCNASQAATDFRNCITETSNAPLPTANITMLTDCAITGVPTLPDVQSWVQSQQYLTQTAANSTYMQSWLVEYMGDKYDINGNKGAYKGLHFDDSGDLEYIFSDTATGGLSIRAMIKQSVINAAANLIRSSKILSHINQEGTTGVGAGMKNLATVYMIPYTTQDGDTITAVYWLDILQSPASAILFNYALNGVTVVQTSNFRPAGGNWKVTVEIVRKAQNSVIVNMLLQGSGTSYSYSQTTVNSGINMNMSTVFTLQAQQISSTPMYTIKGGYLEFKPYRRMS